jgi:tRNA(Ile)-lysidine synthase TilS/MesJ
MKKLEVKIIREYIDVDIKEVAEEILDYFSEVQVDPPTRIDIEKYLNENDFQVTKDDITRIYDEIQFKRNELKNKFFEFVKDSIKDHVNDTLDNLMDIIELEYAIDINDIPFDEKEVKELIKTYIKEYLNENRV